jgi:hypothetical protein
MKFCVAEKDGQLLQGSTLNPNSKGQTLARLFYSPQSNADLESEGFTFQKHCADRFGMVPILMGQTC